jgi:hypothetical protein
MGDDGMQKVLSQSQYTSNEAASQLIFHIRKPWVAPFPKDWDDLEMYV